MIFDLAAGNVMETVLIIESNKATQDALRDLLLLEWPQLNILTVSSGQEGLEIAKRSNIDLVIFEGNCMRSNELDGGVLARELRRLPKMSQTPLIAVTTPTLPNSQITTSLTAYCNAWLLKPFSAERLIRVVSPFTYLYS